MQEVFHLTTTPKDICAIHESHQVIILFALQEGQQALKTWSCSHAMVSRPQCSPPQRAHPLSEAMKSPWSEASRRLDLVTCLWLCSLSLWSLWSSLTWSFLLILRNSREKLEKLAKLRERLSAFLFNLNMANVVLKISRMKRWVLSCGFPSQSSCEVHAQHFLWHRQWLGSLSQWLCCHSQWIDGVCLSPSAVPCWKAILGWESEWKSRQWRSPKKTTDISWQVRLIQAVVPKQQQEQQEQEDEHRTPSRPTKSYQKPKWIWAPSLMPLPLCGESELLCSSLSCTPCFSFVKTGDSRSPFVL